MNHLTLDLFQGLLISHIQLLHAAKQYRISTAAQVWFVVSRISQLELQSQIELNIKRYPPANLTWHSYGKWQMSLMIYHDLQFEHGESSSLQAVQCPCCFIHSIPLYKSDKT